MSDIEFNCPHCDHSLVIDAEGAGATVDCPKCSKPIQIPSPQEPDKHRDSTLAASVSSQPVAAPLSNVQKRSPSAVWALVLGILGVVLSLGIGWLFDCVAIGCGRVSRKRIKSSQGRLTGERMAFAGQILGYVSLIPLIAIPAFLVVKALGTKTTSTFDNIQGQMTSQNVMAETNARPTVASESQVAVTSDASPLEQSAVPERKSPTARKNSKATREIASDTAIERVKNGALEFDTSVKVGKVMDGYKYFTNVTWRSFETKQGRKVVEMSGPMNLDAYKGAKYGTDLDGITLPDKDDVRWSRIKDWEMTYVARFHLSQIDDTFEIAYVGLNVVVKKGGEEKKLEIEDENLVSLKNIYKDEPAAAAVAFLFPVVLSSEPNAADRRMAEELAAGAENRKAEVARAQTQIAELRNQLTGAVEEEKKELEQVETKFASRTALKDEIQSLRLREEEARKRAEALEQQGVPLKKQTEELSAARAAIASHYQPYVEKAQTNAKNARDAADKYHADTLSAAARLINTAIASHRLSVELVPQDGKYGNAMFEGKSSGFSNEVFETKDEAADIGNAMVAAQVGDMLPTQDGTLAVVTGRGTVQFGQNQIRYKVFGRFPKELIDPFARQSFVRMYWGYARNLPAYETAARTAQTQLATVENQAKQAIDNWDAQNGPKLKTMQDQVAAMAGQVAELNSKLSKTSAERAAKEAILNKPQAEQLTAMRDEIKARYAEKRRPLEEQVASLEAKLKAQSAP